MSIWECRSATPEIPAHARGLQQANKLSSLLIIDLGASGRSKRPGAMAGEWGEPEKSLRHLRLDAYRGRSLDRLIDGFGLA